MRHDVNDHTRRILELVVELQDRAAVEWLDGAYTAPSGAPGAKHGTSDPTGVKASQPGKWTDAQRITDRLAKVASDLETFAARFRPRHVTGPCTTAGCEAPATHDGRCWRCHGWMRANQHTRMTPDQVDDGKMVAQWNTRLKHDCGCSTDCCPDGCWDQVPAGQGRVSPRCRKRQQREREAS